MSLQRISTALFVVFGISACSSGGGTTTGATSATGTTSSATGASGTTSSASGTTGAAGTTGATGASSGTTSGAITAQQACGDYATAFCGILSNCSNGFLLARGYGATETCESSETTACLAALAASQTALTPANIEACATATNSESCEDYFDDNAPVDCLPPAGPLSDGTSCTESGQCQSTFCAVPSNGAVCGTCAPAPQAGDSCATIGCGRTGLVCSSETQTCLVPIPDGGTCTDPSACVAGFGCLNLDAGGMPGVCQPKIAVAGVKCDAKNFTRTTCYNHLGLSCSGGHCLQIQVVDAGTTCGSVDAGPGNCPDSETTCIIEQQIDCSSGDTCIETDPATATCVSAAAAGDDCDLVAGPVCGPGQGTCVVESPATSGICTQESNAICN